MFTKLATWWLERKRGYIVLPPPFVGVIMGGNCFATGNYGRFEVTNPSHRLVMTTGSVFITDNHRYQDEAQEA